MLRVLRGPFVSNNDNRAAYELLKMSSSAEAASGKPDKDRSLVQEDDHSSLSSEDDAQVGVKNIEIVSQTWSKWALVSAYIG